MPTLKFSPRNLRSLRERAGLSRITVAYSVNRSEQMLYWYESGRAVPPVLVLCDLADVLDCALGDLFEDEAEGA